VARTEVITVGGLLLLVAIIAYYFPIPFTLADETMSATIPRMVAFCDSGLGQFAQLSPEMVLVCSEYKTFMLGIYGSGLLGIILIIVGAVTGKDKDLVYDVETGKTEYRDEDDESLDIIKKRYAKGEITKEEFVNMKNDLEGNMPIQNYKPEKEEEPVKKSEWSPKKSPILKGVIIGIIAVSIIFGGIFVSMYHSFVVSTSGMEPELQIFDLIRYDEIPFNEIKIGDIIVYYSPSEQDKVIVHRVSAITNEDPLTIRTKGDARPTSIPGMDFPITEEEYIGKVAYVIPQVGYVTRVLTPPFNIIILVAAFVIPIVIMKIRERKSENS